MNKSLEPEKKIEGKFKKAKKQKKKKKDNDERNLKEENTSVKCHSSSNPSCGQLRIKN